jgi:hypothetical protein
VKKKKKQTAHSPTTFHQFFLFILSLVSSNLLLPYRKPVERSTVSSFSLSIRVVLYIDGLLVLSIYTGSVPLPPHLHWYDTVVDIIFSAVRINQNCCDPFILHYTLLIFGLHQINNRTSNKTVGQIGKWLVNTHASQNFH